jgi:nitrite reductase (cytochrome c-552)
MKAILKRRLFWVAFCASILVTLLSAYLMIDIATKKAESKSAFNQVVEITDETEDPALWGANFPHHFADYKKTVDQTRTKYGGSEAVPKKPGPTDPRGQVSQSRLEEDPRLKTLWSGYAFSVDFREERGHSYMLIDQLHTLRQDVVKQPGTCLNCHASTYVPMKKLGGGNLTKGFELLNQMPYFEGAKHVTHPVSCIDCHTPKTMKLRVTRPAFMEGIKLVKAREGVKDFDVNSMASPQEMRTFVCAQCHVEYYFKGKEKRLTFPWHKGLKADQIVSYYDDVKHKDWVHKVSGAEVLKAQHPEFELYSQGIHARSGVSCTDCHMPYKKVGAMKITDHHVQSPVLNLSHSCQTCHKLPEAELKARIEQIQDRTFEMRGVAMDALMEYIAELGVAKEKFKDPQSLNEAYQYQKRAQFYLDFIEAENSMGFHAPGEAMRVLGLSIENTRKGQKTLQKVMKSKSN